MTVLIADDSSDVCAVLKAAFELAGHSVFLAEDGKEVIEVARHQQFDAVILDIAMPLLDGWQVTKWLRMMSGYSTVPIILFTGYTQYYNAPKAKEVGATLLLQKPLDAMTLVSMTESYFKALKRRG